MFGNESKKDPLKGFEASGSKSGSANVSSVLSPASLGSRLKLNPLVSPAKFCIIRSNSGKGLGPLENKVDSRRALISSTSA